jgi:hypothetical protein
MTSSGPPSGDVDLSGWLVPGEPIRWVGRSARPDLPWARVIGSVAGVAVLGAIGFDFYFRSSPGGPSVIFAIVIIAAYLGAVIYGAWSVKRDKVANRYVLTDRRAAVFRIPNQLMAQVGVQSNEFEIVREPGMRLGTLRWGESDPVSQRSRRSGLAMFTMAASVLGGSHPDRVDFRDVADFDYVCAQVRDVRAAWGAPMPPAVTAKRRGAAPVPLGFLDSRGAGVINTIALFIGGVAFVVAIVLLFLTLVPGTALFGFGPVGVLFGLIFPLFFWAVLMASQGRQQRPGEPFLLGFSRGDRRRRQRFPLEYLPVGIVITVAVIFVGAWISMGLVFNSKDLPGQPAYNPVSHSYTANDHGDLIPLTQSQYETAAKAQNRLFLSGTVGFLSFALAMAADEAIRRRRSPYVHHSRSPS